MRKRIFLKLNILLLLVFCFSIHFSVNIKRVKIYANTTFIYGNDISHWQKDVDFYKMKQVSDFVIIRIGYSTKLDGRFLEYMTNAKKANIPIGIYIYSLATTPEEAKNEADWVAQTLSIHNFDKGYLDYPVFFDYEEANFITNNTKKYNTEIINSFTNTICSYGYYPGLYMGGYYFENYILQDQINSDVWLAHYFNDMKDISKFKSLHPNSKITMWQFGADGYNTLNTGKECGVSSSVIDENYCFVNYPNIIQKGGYNGYQTVNPDLPENDLPIPETPSSSVQSSSQNSTNSSNDTDYSVEYDSSEEDIPVFKPITPSKTSGCNSHTNSTFGILLLPLSIFIFLKLS